MPVLSPAETIEAQNPLASPHHGFRGERQPDEEPAPLPQALTLAVSRETGSRGIVIAKQAAKKLGWAFYQQETLEYMAQEDHLGRTLFAGLEEDQQKWVEQRLAALIDSGTLSRHESILELARVVLALGVKGEAVILGRGAGCLLPPASTLYLRVIAPVQDRIAFLTQLERLSPEQAAEQVTQRDDRRARFIASHFGRSPSDLTQFDLLVNSSQLGEETATQIVVAAAKLKAQAWEDLRSLSPDPHPDPL